MRDLIKSHACLLSCKSSATFTYEGLLMCISRKVSQFIGGCELGSLSLTGALMSPEMFLSLELLLAEPTGLDKRAWSAHRPWH